MKRLLPLVFLAACAAPARQKIVVPGRRSLEVRLVKLWAEGIGRLQCADEQARFLGRSKLLPFRWIPRAAASPGHLAFYQDGAVFLIREPLARMVDELKSQRVRTPIVALARETLPWAVHELTHAVIQEEQRARLGRRFGTATQEEETLAYFAQLKCVIEMRRRRGPDERGSLPTVTRVNDRLLSLGPRAYADGASPAPSLLEDGPQAYLDWLHDLLAPAGITPEEVREARARIDLSESFGFHLAEDVSVGLLRDIANATAVLEDPAKTEALRTLLKDRLAAMDAELRSPRWAALKKSWEPPPPAKKKRAKNSFLLP